MEIKKIILPFVAAGTIIAAGVGSQITQRQYDFTSGWEGVKYIPYQDIASPSVWTVCRGITNAAAPGWVIPGKKYTQAECFNKEVEIMQTISIKIGKLVKVETTQEQREMLGDFAWNAGVGALASSTLLKLLNQGKCFAASNEFNRWVMSGGRKWKGLANRRAAEDDNFGKWCTK